MRTLLWFALLALLGLVAAALVAPRVAGPDSASAVVAAAVICVATGLIALLPAAIVAPRYPDYLMQAGLAAMLIRLSLTLGVGAAYLRWYAPPRAVFMSAMVVAYLVLLAFETWAIVRLVKQYWRAPQSD